MDINKIKWADEVSALKVEASGTQQGRGWDTSDGTIAGIPEKPNLQQTNGWMHAVYKWLEYLSGLKSPVGTVLTSFLTEDQFNNETSGQWVLCDGRTCAGSSYNSLTGRSVVPDLRGMVLAGAGSHGSQINSQDVSPIGQLNELIEESPSLNSIRVYAVTGGERWQTGNLPITTSGMVFQGASSNADAQMGYCTSTDYTQFYRYTSNPTMIYNGMMGKYGSSGSPTAFNNSGHRHSFTGKITGKAYHEEFSVDQPIFAKNATLTSTNDKPYTVASDSVGCNYFIRIN